MNSNRIGKDLDAIQVFAIGQRAHDWGCTVRRLRTAPNKLRTDIVANYDAVGEELHLLAIALEQIAKCLEWLHSRLPDDIQALASNFNREWDTEILEGPEEGGSGRKIPVRRVSSLRDVLEHEVDYIAGSGKHPHFMSPSWRDEGYNPDTFLMWSGITGEVDIDSALGKTYRLKKVCDAAVALELPLLHWLNEMHARLPAKSGDDARDLP